MKRETYERALRSAAQISFLSLPLVGACGEPGAEPAEDTVAGLVSELCADGCEAALKGAYPNGTMPRGRRSVCARASLSLRSSSVAVILPRLWTP
jgi:hypothetical protein